MNSYNWKTNSVSEEAIAVSVCHHLRECINLNVRYLEEQANAIAQQIPYVIGMNQAIGDQAAIEFAIGFYDGLLTGRAIEQAY